MLLFEFMLMFLLSSNPVLLPVFEEFDAPALEEFEAPVSEEFEEPEEPGEPEEPESDVLPLDVEPPGP